MTARAKYTKYKLHCRRKPKKQNMRDKRVEKEKQARLRERERESVLNANLFNLIHEIPMILLGVTIAQAIHKTANKDQ